MDIQIIENFHRFIERKKYVLHPGCGSYSDPRQDANIGTSSPDVDNSQDPAAAVTAENKTPRIVPDCGI